YVTFLDNDTEVEPDWLKQLVSCIEKDVTVGAVQSKILLYQNKKLLNSRGCKVNYLMVAWCDGLGKLDKPQEDNVQEITYATGCAMILSISALQKIGLFDGDLFIEGDDLDVGLRLH